MLAGDVANRIRPASNEEVPKDSASNSAYESMMPGPLNGRNFLFSGSRDSGAFCSLLASFGWLHTSTYTSGSEDLRWRRWNIDQLCRLNFDQMLWLPPQEDSCGQL